MTPIFYSVLFCLGVIAFNPLAESTEGFFIYPRLLAIALIFILNGWNLLSLRVPLIAAIKSDPTKFFGFFVFWFIFLIFGMVSTFRSFIFERSLYGSSILGDGLLYWAGLAAFLISEVCFIGLCPEKMKGRVQGILLGVFVLSFVVLFQCFNHSFQWVYGLDWFSDPAMERMLLGVDWEINSPIGLFSHRGHAAFVLGFGNVLALHAWQKKWITSPAAISILALSGLALIFTQTRGAILGTSFVWAYLILQSYRSSKAFSREAAYGGGLLLLSWLFFQVAGDWMGIEKRVLPSWFDAVVVEGSSDAQDEKLNRFTQHRTELWSQAWNGILISPWRGWGFDGFGIAYPFITGCIKPEQMKNANSVQVEDHSEGPEVQKPETHTSTQIVCQVPMNKAHNIVLDTALSIGLPGMFVYLLGIVWFLIQIARSPARGLEGLALVYLIFAMTWFESAQYSHLGWWAIAAGLGLSKKEFD